MIMAERKGFQQRVVLTKESPLLLIPELLCQHWPIVVGCMERSLCMRGYVNGSVGVLLWGLSIMNGLLKG